MTPAPDVVGPAEVRVLLGGISRQRLSQLRGKEDRHAGTFPEPQRLEIGDVWDRAEIEAWQHSRTSPRRRTMIVFLRDYRREGNVSRAARVAGVHYSTGLRWLRELGVPTPRERE